MKKLQTHLEQGGYRVFVLPEVATILFSSGIKHLYLSNDEFVHNFQVAIIR